VCVKEMREALAAAERERDDARAGRKEAVRETRGGCIEGRLCLSRVEVPGVVASGGMMRSLCSSSSTEMCRVRGPSPSLTAVRVPIVTAVAVVTDGCGVCLQSGGGGQGCAARVGGAHCRVLAEERQATRRRHCRQGSVSRHQDPPLLVPYELPASPQEVIIMDTAGVACTTPLNVIAVSAWVVCTPSPTGVSPPPRFPSTDLCRCHQSERLSELECERDSLAGEVDKAQAEITAHKADAKNTWQKIQVR
jgi:hypothetical protein